MEYFLSIFFATFILEDVALISALALIADGKMTFNLALAACFLGISIGDIGLYFIGRFAGRLGLDTKLKSNKSINSVLAKLEHSSLLDSMIFISRLVPGTRLPTYLVAGLVRYSFYKFTVYTFISVGLWVFFALAIGKSVNTALSNHLYLSLFIFTVLLILIKKYLPALVLKWPRKALLQSWRKWTHFEFWPAWFFYIPLYFWYFFLSLKYRNFFLPFFANPSIINGGLIGESKWDFLKFLDMEASSTLRAIKVDKAIKITELSHLLKVNNFDYPFILKPDVGQRGFGVRIIRNDFELSEYLAASNFDLIVQKLSQLQNEAGLFYIRMPGENDGFIFSITDKKFPFVIGDGKSKLGDLILADPRARIMASTYFERHQKKLDSPAAKNEKIILSECGNHCQGAIFLNGHTLNSKALTLAVEKIVQKIPTFYFGRLDVKYKDAQSLSDGEFEIIEINGAGAEATHIWDSRTPLLEAYRTLFLQWKILFKIGYQIRSDKNFKSNLDLKFFITESFKVYFRKERLSVSS